jgi:ribonucleotide monophosphatase NagD (HAD superfamily)
MERNKTIMVGDKLSTDILWGNNGQLSTLLVMTGVTSKSELFSKENQIIPSYYIDSFSSLSKT